MGGFLLNAPFSEAHSSLPNTERNTAGAMVSFFYLSPDPLPPALPFLRASNNPPPPGRGEEQAAMTMALRA